MRMRVQSLALLSGFVGFLCSVLSLPQSLPTHNKDLEVQDEKYCSGAGIEPAGFILQGWRQTVRREVVPARRCCSSAGIDLVVSLHRDGGRRSLQAGAISSGWEQFWVKGNSP